MSVEWFRRTEPVINLIVETASVFVRSSDFVSCPVGFEGGVTAVMVNLWMMIGKSSSTIWP